MPCSHPAERDGQKVRPDAAEVGRDDHGGKQRDVRGLRQGVPKQQPQTMAMAIKRAAEGIGRGGAAAELSVAEYELLDGSQSAPSTPSRICTRLRTARRHDLGRAFVGTDLASRP